MPPDSYSQNNNGINSNPYSPGEYKKTNPRKLLFIAVGVVVTIVIIGLIVIFSKPESQQDKYIKSATAAAKKSTPNAEVKDVKVAGGYASATVSDPTARGQANSGNQTYFKVNNDGSMTQIAKGSSFSAVDLSGLGMPLSTQAKLTGRNLTQIQQDLALTCGYSGGNASGYLGFDSSFKPDGWQIDAAMLDRIEHALAPAISSKNAVAKDGQKVVCVNATREKSNVTTDKQTYISTFTLELQFITSNGTSTSHTFTFTSGDRNFHNYTLDGQKIKAN